MACTAANGLADDGKGDNKALPEYQLGPKASLGSHWDNVFSKLSAKCKPKMSFLNDEYKDPAVWSKKARTMVLENFHYSPPECDFNPEVLERVDCGDYYRERVDINTTPDIRVSLYLLIPKKLNKPAPAIVNLHDHGGFYFWGKEKLVHVEPENPVLTAYKKRLYHGRSTADELVKRGFVVIVADLLHWGERGMYLDDDPQRIKKRTLEVSDQDVKEFNARSWAHEELIGRTSLTCGVTWAGINMWDDIRVTDYLLTRPEVDKQRVGCIGLSMGAMRSIFLGGLHPAVRATVTVGWMAEYQPMAKSRVRGGIGFTKLVPGMYQNLDWPDMAGLHWPGSLMVINGLQDAMYPLESARRSFDKIERIYTKMGIPEKYKGVFYDGPHEYNIAMQEMSFDWIERQLSLT